MAEFHWATMTVTSSFENVNSPMVHVTMFNSTADKRGTGYMLYHEGWAITPVQVEPIAKRVSRFYCPFCGKGKWSRSAAVQHLENCWRNPSARSCGTCSHRGSSDRSAIWCDIGVNWRMPEGEDTKIIRQCESWVPK